MELRDIDTINAELELALPGEEMPSAAVEMPDDDTAEALPESDDSVVVQVPVDTTDKNETLH
jgi:hypothetical protein